MTPSIDNIPDGAFSQPTNNMARDKNMPIAVVGMSFRGPKDATSVENLWKMISERREGWSKIPIEKWNNGAFYHPDNARHGTINVEGGHFLEEDLARFDAPFFNMTDSEAAALDPQQRLLLEGAFEALENAGIPLEKIMGSKTACYVGSFSGDYTDMLLRDPDCVPMYQCTNAGQSRAITANRVSYFFDLKGPSVTVDTACSGSLVALHLACQSLRTGDAKLAFAAGVNTVLSHEFMSTMSMMRFLSPDGRCYTFDERANGYARGEGVGYLILKPLEDALRDRDTIRAIIRGSGSNSDGKTSGITLPSGTAQEQLIRDVYDTAGLDPLDTEYVECHGTGTQAGDPQETSTLARVFSTPERSPGIPLRIGSVKTNIGHLEGASGIAGAIKAIMMLENRMYLPNRNFQKLNPRIRLDEWKLKIQLDLEPWESVGSRRISVNSFGYGGSNAHVIFEESEGYLFSRGLKGSFRKKKALLPIKKETGNSNFAHGHVDGQINSIGAGFVRNHAHIVVSNDNSRKSINGEINGHDVSHSNSYTNGHLDSQASDLETARPRLFSLSSFDEASGKKQIERLKTYLQERATIIDDKFMNNLAFTLNERRSKFMWKLAVPATSPKSLIEALESNRRHLRAVKKPTIGFVFTGQGAQWCGMGKELLHAFPVFSHAIGRIDAYLNSIGAPFDVKTEMTRDPKGSQINLPIYSQAICSAIQIALVDLLRSWGIKPASVTGHSSGEIAAAYTMGALSMEDAIAVAYYRGLAAHNMQQSGKRKGSMMAVGLAEADVEPYLTNLKQGSAVVACVNSPTSMTISGDVAAIDELQAILAEKRLFARKLAIEVAYHSPHMEFVADEYRASLANLLTPKKGNITDGPVSEDEDEDEVGVEFFSSVFGAKASATDLGPEYWIQNLLGKVKFADSLRLLCLETTDPSARGKGSKGKGKWRKKKRAGAATKVTVDMLIEIGPHSALAGPIKQILKADPTINIASPSYTSVLVRKTSAITSALSVAASLLTSGYPIDVAAINRPKGVGTNDDDPEVLVDLPSYPWNHSNAYWAEPRISKVYRNRIFPRTDLLGVLDRNSSTLEPRWRNYLRTTEIPWIQDHKIQSNVVFPAAGYIAMVLEAAFQVSSTMSDVAIIGYKLRDLAFGAALIITEQVSAEVMTSMRPHGNLVKTSADAWYEFSICSVTDDNRWTEHSRGLVSVMSASSIINEVSGSVETDAEAARVCKIFDDAEVKCIHEVEVRKFYDHLTTIGLEYGRTFAGMNKARSAGDGTCVAEIMIADTAITMPMNFQYPLVIHPSTLDTILHPVFVALSAEKLIENPAVPTSIDSIFISHSLESNPGSHLRVLASTQMKDEHVIANIAVVEGENGPAKELGVSIQGLNCTVLARDGEEITEQESQRVAYNLQWEADVDFLSAEQTANMVAKNTCGEEELRALASYEEAAYHYITDAFSIIEPGELKAMEPHLQRKYLALDGLAHRFRTKQIKDPASILGKMGDATKAEFLQSVRSSSPEGEILCAVGEQMVDIFRGKVDMRSVLAGENRLESYRSKTPRFVRNYDATARYLSLLGHKDPHMSILEVGAGAGSATLPILQTLGGAYGEVASFKSYTFTDTDTSGFDSASKILGPWKDLLKFKQLDIEGDLDDQGYDSNSFDVVILAHGMYMSVSRDAVLKNVHALLKPNGRLILIDIVPETESMAGSMVLGNLGSWRGGSELTNSPAAWRETLTKAGFSGFELSVDNMAEMAGFKSLMMISKAISESKLHKPNVMLVVEEGDCGVSLQELESWLCDLGLQVEISSLADAKIAGKTCIVLSELKHSILNSPDAVMFESIRDIFIRSAGVLWVVRGGTMTSKNPTASLVTGFARTARSETGDRTIVTLDLDAENLASGEAAARTIFDLFRNHFTLGLPAENLDTEYAERHGMLMIPRVIESSDINGRIASSLGKPMPVNQTFYQKDRPLRVETGALGKSHTAHFVDVENIGGLPDDFIEIEVKSWGLSKKDAQSAFTQLSGHHSLGNECSGTIRDIGKDVHEFNIGDRVTCYGSGTIASYYRDGASRFQKIPDYMSFGLAAALPIAYCTAYYVVHNLARVSRSETILIHNAAEPCGQAIVELCKLIGSHVFATVASVAQKEVLTKKLSLPEDQILFSGDGDFVKGVMRMTEGKGVDVIFNSLSGPGEMQRLSWNCIAPYGRFIELSGRDLTNSTRLEMGNFAKDVTFASFDLANLVNQKPKVAERLLSDVIGFFRAGVLKGPAPLLQYEISDIDKALQEIHSGQVVGKVILTANENTIVKAVPQNKSHELLRQDASYLLVGGLGGIGRATAMWMLDHGAKHIVFANRSGDTKQGARETVQALEARGAKVAVYSCDVSNMSHVSDMVSKVSKDMPPICGVIQAAMVLRDTMIEKLSVDDYNAVLQPKVQGTWNLHHFLPHSMDFFIILSSISGVIGNASQSAYATACTFLDAFAAYRNSMGLAAVTLDLGVITGIGHLAENKELAAAMELQGFEGTDEKKLMALIESAIAEPLRTSSNTGSTLSQTITGLGMWKEGQSLGNFNAPIFAQFRRRGLDTNVQGSGTGCRASWREAIGAATNIDEAATAVCAALGDKLAARLNMPVDHIVSTKTISEYGVDSLVAVEIRNWIAKEIESLVPILEILANQSLLQLSTKIAAKSKLVRVKGKEEDEEEALE